MQELIERFKRVRQTTLKLCQPLEQEDYVVQPIVDVSPPKWNLGHTSWFFENFILATYKKGYQRFHPEFNFLFNSYYESVGERVFRGSRGDLTRPVLQQVLDYRNYVDQHLEDLLSDFSGDEASIKKLVTLGLQHEQQHQELLLTDLKYILGRNPLFPQYSKEPLSVESVGIRLQEKFLEVPEGLYDIGHQEEGFCFDNEQGAHKVFLHSFRVQDRLITNREYMEFMADGGYGDFRHWLMEGWAWVKANQQKAPLYWHKIDDEWQQFTLHGLQPILPEEPITHISYYEAEAYAQWRGKRLLTEFEWEAACKLFHNQVQPEDNFLDTARFAPRGRRGESPQFLGDVWEWTSSAYLSYPYYQKEAGALGEYNGKFMINQMVLRGGSCATPRNHIRISYRNFFHPDKQWQFSGLRLAESI